MNPTEEDAYWRDNYTREPYHVPGRPYAIPSRPTGWAGLPWAAMKATSMPWSPDWRTTGVPAMPRAAWPGLMCALPTRAAWDRASNRPTPAWAAQAPRALRVPWEPWMTRLTVTMWWKSSTTCWSLPATASTASILRRPCRFGRTQSIFLRHSQQCAATALGAGARNSPLWGRAASGGTVAGAVHRGWVSVKAALSSRDDKAVLEECERGEDAAVARYRKALNAALPADVRALLERQARAPSATRRSACAARQLRQR